MYGLSATSLAMEAGETMDTGYLLKSLLKCMEKWYLMLRAEKYFEIDDAYQQKLLNYNQWAYYEKDDQVIKAKIIGVKNYGNIVLENELGDIFEYGLKELKFII
jgi:BirA family biotin operon repressor/biotin-[acetyl-CoA-carboxylase] ligase